MEREIEENREEKVRGRMRVWKMEIGGGHEIASREKEKQWVE